MHTDKKITKEDTWRPADLRRYIREEERGDFRKRDESERKHHRGDSTEKRHRDPEKEYRREKDNIRERTDENVKDRYSERRKEGSRDRREERDKDREKRRERDRQGDVNKYVDDYRENKDRRRDREERHDRDKEGSRDKEKERVRDREKYYQEEKDRRREERDKERSRDKEKERAREREKYYEEEKDRRREERDKERARDKEKERAREREKYYAEEKDRRREERDKERSRDKEKERVREKEKYYDEEKDRRREERDKERSRDKEKERVREKEKYYDEEKDRRREERDKERRREERDREHRNERERRRHEPSGEEGRDRIEKYDRDQRDRHREREQHKDEYEVKRSEKERRDRHADRKQSELNEERDYREERRKDKDERERRHKDRRDYKPDSDSREHRDLRKSSEEVLDHRSDRERTERDKYKDRRYQEERDPERNHRDKANPKKSASESSHPHKTTIETEDVVMVSGHQAPSLKDVGHTEAPITSDQDAAEPEYEDDFEDYEEDFEEMDESANDSEERELSEEKEELSAKRKAEIKAIQRAMDEENERMGTAQSRQSPIREDEDRPKWSRGSEKSQSKSSQRGKFINFVAAKQREVNKKVATQQKKRSTELLRLIDLDFSVTSSLLDLPPVNEYDMYIRNFGTANTKQAYVQCNEDNADRDIQTEEIELCEKWTQHPPEHYGACGDPNLSQDPQNRTITEMNFDSKRLTAFLRSASQVMVVLLEEDQAERKSLRKLQSQTDTLSFSDGSLQLNTKLPFLYGRSISLIHFSQVQKHTMMSVHRPTTKPSAVRLDSCTIICIWNIWEPSKPQKILVYESEVLCCCFSPGKAILVFAGTSVGSVVLWDLREQACNHYRLTIGEDEWTLRQPTFSTDAVMAGSGHLSSVTSVEVVPSAIAGGLRPEVPLLASDEESTGLSFQLASLDESGVLNFWVVVELPKANESGSQTDLGLRPGGKVKLLHSSSLLTAERVSQREATKTGPLQTLQLKFLPSDSNHFFIGTNMGIVSHGTSHGLKAPPKFYKFHEGAVRPVDVNSIGFSPFRQHLFLVGCGDGSIRLHVVSHEQPLTEWNNLTAGEPVVSLQWAQTRPTVFCVLDAASNFHIWDLLKNETEPVVTERITADRVTAMATFGDSGQQNTYSGVALAHESGKIEMQYFTKNLTVPSPAEDEKLEYLMKEAF